MEVPETRYARSGDVDLVAGSGIELVDRGGTELKGVPRDWRLYAVGSLDPA